MKEIVSKMNHEMTISVFLIVVSLLGQSEGELGRPFGQLVYHLKQSEGEQGDSFLLGSGPEGNDVL